MTDNDHVPGPTGSERLVAQPPKRKKRLFSFSSDGEDDLSERMMVGATPQSIGADLRTARLARGESVADVAQQLRLRESYIEAIEAGHFEALPGVTYAIGFLRSYARYLRLDADDLVRRFKEEVADIPPPADLAFLEPVSESRVPRGGLVMFAILLALAAYGGWYYLSTRDLTIADLVPAVPEQFGGIPSIGDRSDGSTPTAQQREVAPPGPSEEAADATAGEPVDGAPAAPERLSDGGPDVLPPSPDGTVASPDGTAPPPQTIPPVPSLDGALDGAPDAAPSRRAEAPAAAGADSPRVYGEGTPGSRVTLQARGDSWVQVRAADDTLLMTRLLRMGDSYRVPNQPGLKLMTGDAGALEVLVDGQPVPPLGAAGAVKRNVSLDAERLKAGTAVTN